MKIRVENLFFSFSLRQVTVVWVGKFIQLSLFHAFSLNYYLYLLTNMEIFTLLDNICGMTQIEWKTSAMMNCVNIKVVCSMSESHFRTHFMAHQINLLRKIEFHVIMKSWFAHASQASQFTLIFSSTTVKNEYYFENLRLFSSHFLWIVWFGRGRWKYEISLIHWWLATRTWPWSQFTWNFHFTHDDESLTDALENVKIRENCENLQNCTRKTHKIYFLLIFIHEF